MNRHTKKIVDIINQHAAKVSSRAKIFDNFLHCATAVLDRDEDAFKNVEDKQLNLELFAELIGALDDSISVKVLRDHILGIDFEIPTDSSHKPCYRDVLGEIFRELELYAQDAGQVFTPQHVADITAEVALTPDFVRQQIDKFGFVTVVENCCGSGALVLGSLNALLKCSVNPCRQAIVHAFDLDERCVRMAFVQLSLYCIPAVVGCRNAISGELCGKSFITPALKKIFNNC